MNLSPWVGSAAAACCRNIQSQIIESNNRFWSFDLLHSRFIVKPVLAIAAPNWQCYPQFCSRPIPGYYSRLFFFNAACLSVKSCPPRDLGISILRSILVRVDYIAFLLTSCPLQLVLTTRADCHDIITSCGN